MISGLTEKYKALITIDRAQGHNVATKDSKAAAGDQSTFQALLDKGDKRSRKETLEMQALGKKIKKDSLEN